MKASRAVLVLTLSCLILQSESQSNRKGNGRRNGRRDGRQSGKTTVVSCRVFRRGMCSDMDRNVITINKSITNSARCQQYCYATSGCAAFTHFEQTRSQTRRCVLFRDCNGDLDKCRDCISGPIMPRINECLAARQEEAPAPAPGLETDYTDPESNYDVVVDDVYDEDYDDAYDYETVDDTPTYDEATYDAAVVEDTDTEPTIDYDFEYRDEENEAPLDIPLEEEALDEPEEEQEETEVNIDAGFLADSEGTSVDLAGVETVTPASGGNVVRPDQGNTFVFFFCALGGTNSQGAVNIVDLLNTGLGNAAQSLTIAPMPAQVVRGGQTNSAYTNGAITTCSQGFTILSPYGFIYKPGSCYDYSLTANTWKDTGARLTSFRQGATITKLGRYLLATGGYRQKRSLNTVEVFDPKKPKAGWKKLSKLRMPTSVAEHCAVTLPGRNGKEVIITGGKGREKRVMKLDVKTQKWFSLNRLTVGRRKHACIKASINGRPGLVVSGGSSRTGTNITSVEFYDARTGEWFTLPSLQRGRRSHAMTVTKGKLIVAGGEGVGRGGRQYYDDVEVFTGSRWVTSKRTLDRPRSGFSLLKIPKDRSPRASIKSSKSSKSSRRSRPSKRSKTSKRSPKSSDARAGSQNSRG